MRSHQIPKRDSAERRLPQRAAAPERDDLKALPETMRTIAEATSLDVVEKLVGACGGSSVFISQRDGGALAKLIGADNAARIVKVFGPDPLMIPTCRALQIRRRNRQIRAAHAAGTSVMKIARSLNLHHRTVWRVLASGRERG